MIREGIVPDLIANLSNTNLFFYSSLQDQPSFDNLDMWRKEFAHYADVRDADKFPFVLLGNKIDADDIKITRELAEQW